MKTQRKKLVISTIRQAAPNAKTGLPGNFLINSTPDKPNWFPRREIRNALTGSLGEGAANLPPMALKGLVLAYDEYTIDQADIDKAIAAGGEGVSITAQGRPITFKKPGIHNVNIELDTEAILEKYGLVDVVKVVQLMRGEVTTRRAIAPTRPTPDTNDTIIDEGEVKEPLPNDEHPMPEILTGVTADKAGVYLNADGSALTAEQKTALEEWVATAPAL